MKRVELENRLIRFSVMVNEIINRLPKNYFGENIAKQLARSAVSPVLNYAEAQSAESRKDFIHKMKVVLKELRETYAGLKLIEESKQINISEKLQKTINENNELISIFVSSIETARINDLKSKINKSKS